MFLRGKYICRTRDRRYQADYVRALAEGSQTRPTVQTAGSANTAHREACVFFWETVFCEADPESDQMDIGSHKSIFRKMYLRPSASRAHTTQHDIACYSAPPVANQLGKNPTHPGRSSSSCRECIASSTALYRFFPFEIQSNARLTMLQRRIVSANGVFRVVSFS